MSCARHRWVWNHQIPGRQLEAEVPRCADCGQLAPLDHVEALNELEQRARGEVLEVDEVPTPPEAPVVDEPPAPASTVPSAKSKRGGR